MKKEGIKTNEIARLRKLKESTINDHLLEHLLLTKMHFITCRRDEGCRGVQRTFRNEQYPKYKEAKDQFEAKGKLISSYSDTNKSKP